MQRRDRTAEIGRVLDDPARRASTSVRLALRPTSWSWVTRMIVMPLCSFSSRRSLDHFLAGPRVEVAGRLVGHEDRRAVDQRPGDRHALLLAAGELAGVVVHPVAQAHLAEHLDGALPSLPAGDARASTSSGSSTFSRALVRASRLKFWKTKPICRLRSLARASRDIEVTSSPSRR